MSAPSQLKLDQLQETLARLEIELAKVQAKHAEDSEPFHESVECMYIFIEGFQIGWILQYGVLHADLDAFLARLGKLINRQRFEKILTQYKAGRVVAQEVYNDRIKRTGDEDAAGGTGATAAFGE